MAKLPPINSVVPEVVEAFSAADEEESAVADGQESAGGKAHNEEVFLSVSRTNFIYKYMRHQPLFLLWTLYVVVFFMYVENIQMVRTASRIYSIVEKAHSQAGLAEFSSMDTCDTANLWMAQSLPTLMSTVLTICPTCKIALDGDHPRRNISYNDKVSAVDVDTYDEWFDLGKVSREFSEERASQ